MAVVGVAVVEAGVLVVDGLGEVLVVVRDAGSAWAVPVVMAGVVLSPRARTPAATRWGVVERIRAL